MTNAVLPVVIVKNIKRPASKPLANFSCLPFLFGIALAIPVQGQTRAYVMNANSNSVSVIDTSTDTVATNVPVTGTDPFGIAITRMGPVPTGR